MPRINIEPRHYTHPVDIGEVRQLCDDIVLLSQELTSLCGDLNLSEEKIVRMMELAQCLRVDARTVKAMIRY